MENASKALIIAGAILISILLVGVGVLIYNGAIGGINEAVIKMSQQEKDMFNAQFVKYEGDRVTGSNVKALIQEVISSNNANKDVEGKQVTVDSISDNSGLTAHKLTINTGKKYRVVTTYNESTGLINTITITEGT